VSGSAWDDVDVPNLRRVVAGSAVAVTALQSVTARLALKAGRRDYADVVWGPGLATVAVIGAMLGSGDARRRWGLAAVSVAWAVRLENQMLGRVKGAEEEDARYTEFLEGDGPATVVAKVFVTQALAQMIVSAPLQLAASSRLPRRGLRRALVPVGLATMVGGAVVEALADREKTEYSKRDRDERPDVLDTGLWGLSRHPNYFGDSVVWDGAWLTAAASPPASWTLPAPILMSYFLMYATGAKRTERRMQERPGYRDYQRRVAFFFPRPGKS
jgi:steroid 5-alpha reductase family enzyme